MTTPEKGIRRINTLRGARYLETDINGGPGVLKNAKAATLIETPERDISELKNDTKEGDRATIPLGSQYTTMQVKEDNPTEGRTLNGT